MSFDPFRPNLNRLLDLSGCFPTLLGFVVALLLVPCSFPAHSAMLLNNFDAIRGNPTNQPRGSEACFFSLIIFVWDVW